MYRTQNHVNADRAVSKTTDFILQTGSTIQIVDGDIDYGTDLHVQLPISPSRWPEHSDHKKWEMSGLYIHVQVKYHALGSEKPRLDVDHLECWATSPIPHYVAYAVERTSAPGTSASGLNLFWLLPPDIQKLYDTCKQDGTKSKDVDQVTDLNRISFHLDADSRSRFSTQGTLTAHLEELRNIDEKGLELKLWWIDRILSGGETFCSIQDIPKHLRGHAHEQIHENQHRYSSNDPLSSNFKVDLYELIHDVAVMSSFSGKVDDPEPFMDYWTELGYAKNAVAALNRYKPDGPWTKVHKLDELASVLQEIEENELYE